MEPTTALSDLDKGPKNVPYKSVLFETLKRIENQAFLFVIVIAVLLVALAMRGTALGTSDLRFVVLVIAFLALTVIMIEVRGKVSAQGEQLEDQQKLINQLVRDSISPDVFHHLAGITVLKKYIYRQNAAVNWAREFYDLKHRGFIEGKPGKLCEFREEFDGINITENVQPTKTGLIYVELHKEDIPKRWLSTDPQQ
jgi:hypothetical protein